MRYLSVCSGIEAASAAWMPLGWRPVAFSEIEPFPTSVLAHHHPGVPNWGDMTKYKEWPDEPIDLLCGGTPCQSFSVAGLRKGLADPRGNLMLTFGAIAAKYRPRWLVWENVPGVLSSNGGRDFGAFLGLLAELGYGFAYRVLDAQYVRVESHPRAVPQRRRRVFVVGHSGGQWHRAAAVLFERASLCGHPAPSREAGQVAPTIPSRSLGGGGLGTDFDCDGGLIQAYGGNNHSGPIDVATARNACASASGRMDFETETFLVAPVGVTIHGTDPTVQKVASYDEVAQCLRARTPGYIDNSSTTVVQQPVSYGIRTANTSSNGWGIQEECTHTLDCAQGVAVAQPVAFDTTQITSAANRSNPQPGDPCHPLAAGAHAPAIAFSCKDSGQDAGEISPTLRAMGGNVPNGGGQVAVAVALRGREGGATAELGDEVQNCLRASSGGGDKPHVLTAMQVRRLTPLECERLMGFPDGHTLIPWRKKPASECPDGPRYKSLGNSWAVNCARWIGERIEAVEAIAQQKVEAA